MKPWIKRIRELMQQRGITQEALASQIGRGQSWVNHKLSGRRKANVEDLILIAQALEIEPAALLENVTNYELLKDRLLGVSEPHSSYLHSEMGKLENKLNQLDQETADNFLRETHRSLDKLLKDERLK